LSFFWAMKKILLFFILVTCSGDEFFAQPFQVACSATTCVDQPITVSVTVLPPGATSYSWTIYPAAIVNVISATQTNLTFTLCGSHTINCVAYNASGNPTNSVTITSTAICPGVIITPAFQTICPGVSATLTANGASSYTWSNSQNGAIINPTPSATTVYSVTGSVNECSATATVSAINLTVNASNTSVCAGNTVALVATGASNYIWMGSSFSIPVFQSSIGVGAGSYTVSSPGSPLACMHFITIAIANCVGIKIESPKYESDFTFNPNPAKDLLFIGSENDIQNFCVELSDLLGKKVKVENPGRDDQKNSYFIDVTELNQGIYFISIISEGKIQYRCKIVKE
jgi:hypothetical protein